MYYGSNTGSVQATSLEKSSSSSTGLERVEARSPTPLLEAKLRTIKKLLHPN